MRTDLTNMTPSSRRSNAVIAMSLMLGLMFAGLGARLWLGWWQGFLPDLQCWQIWGLDPWEFTRSDPYPADLCLPMNYPPMYMSIVRLQRWIHRSLHLPGDYTRPLEFHFHENPDVWRPFVLYLKLPAIIADLVAAWIIWKIGWHLQRLYTSVLVAAFYLFLPAILYDGAYFGQTDTILTMFLIAGFWAWLVRRPVWFGAMVTGAALMKAQAIFALPAFAVGLIGWRRCEIVIDTCAEVSARESPVYSCTSRCGSAWPGVALGGMIMLIIVAMLAWSTGMLHQFYAGYFGITDGPYQYVSVRAYNLWWLLTRPWDRFGRMYDLPQDSALLWGMVRYRTAGLLLFFSIIGIIVWRLHRSRYSPYAMALALVASGWTFFNCLTQMHERYSVPAVGLMTLLLFWGPKWFWLTLLASFTVMLNLAEVCELVIPVTWARGFVSYFVNAQVSSMWILFATIHVLMVPLSIEALWRQGIAPVRHKRIHDKTG